MGTSTTVSGLCPVLALEQHDLITDQNLNSLKLSTYKRTVGTVVDITCYVSSKYKLNGSPRVTCVDGAWQPTPPTCVRIDGLTTSLPGSENTTVSADEDGGLATYSLLLIVMASIVAMFIFVVFAIIIYRCFCITGKRSSKVASYPSDDVPVFSKVSATPSNLSNMSTSSIGPAFNSTWPTNGNRAWTYLSVDRLLRDIERSRRENPQHSWRDFASMTTDHSYGHA